MEKGAKKCHFSHSEVFFPVLTSQHCPSQEEWAPTKRDGRSEISLAAQQSISSQPNTGEQHHCLKKPAMVTHTDVWWLSAGTVCEQFPPLKDFLRQYEDAVCGQTHDGACLLDLGCLLKWLTETELPTYLSEWIGYRVFGWKAQMYYEWSQYMLWL